MKDKLVDTASELFLQLGFKSVTMDDLAEQMGISKKTIYAHFRNKTDLIDACACSIFDKISAGIDCISDQGLNPIEELYEIKKFAMMHLKNEKSSPQYQLKKYYPQIYKSLNAKKYNMMKDCVLTNIKRGMEMGIYRENLDAHFVARIYFSGVTSLNDDDLFPKAGFPMPQLMDQYLEYHLRGIVTPKGRNILNTIINSNQE
ncbi:TetR/AcrR family transcriptional regulator [Robiginitalea sp. SC105]|uniref:TetR/AcrR family transcriptional regulator n=1 Tax=Robiginitalea sp. SC105 TaxID=2762332 RepID=UPI00163AF895|nr:TetR/AcrR family transcriptional regulator [Robiginitalea sp. SC105]MBC2838425.1 TetR/AcrR family transcriptional regulator [Robiginitalea sp. SC105]